MNKKGFTLVELIAVVSIIAIIALIATPSIMTLSNNSKKEQVISDAKKLISDVKYKSKLIEYEEFYPDEIEGSCTEICINNSNFSDSIKTDPDGNKYDEKESCVKVLYQNGKNNYYVKLASKNETEYKRGISTSKEKIAYVLESDLNKDTSVKYDGLINDTEEETTCTKTDENITGETYICGCLTYSEYVIYNTYIADSCIKQDEVCTNESCTKTTCSKTGGTDSDTWNIKEQIKTCNEYEYCER